MIHYLSYYRTDKNLGRAMNDAVNSLCIPDSDFIVLTDLDMCFLTPYAGKQIEYVSERTDFGLLGCLTNRLGGDHQLLNGFSEHLDAHREYFKAVEAEKNNFGVVEETKKSIAGFFMMFRKSTWFEVGGFKESTLRADIEFTKSVRESGYKTGIMKGLMVFHLYRPWKLSYLKAKKYHKHLI